MTIGIREIPLGLLSWRAVGLPRQPTARHRFCGQRLQIRWLQACFLGGLDRFLSCSFRFRGYRLSSFVQLRLLNRRCIRFFGGISLGSGLIGFLLPLTRGSRGGAASQPVV